MRRPSPRRWSSGAMPSSPAGRTPDRKSTRLNSSHLVISYAVLLDRKSTRLNSSHLVISYAVFCLKKKTSTRSTHLDMRYVLYGFMRARYAHASSDRVNSEYVQVEL